MKTSIGSTLLAFLLPVILSGGCTPAAATPSLSPASTALPSIPPAAEALVEDTQPQTVHVLADGSGDLATLEEAIETVASNSIIVLDAGQFEFSEPVMINKSLTIQGAGPGQTTIAHSGGGSPGITFEGEQLTVTDISLTRTGEFASNILLVTGGEVHLENCIVSGGGRSEDESIQGVGLWLRGNAAVTVNDCTFENNMGPGVVAGGNARVMIDRVMSIGNQMGFGFLEEASGEIRNSTISENEREGIFVAGLAQVTIAGNTIENNGAMGIHFQLEADGGEVRDNQLAQNDRGRAGTDIMIWEEYSPALIRNTCDGQGKSILGGDHNGIVFIARGSIPTKPTLLGNSCNVARCTTSTGTLLTLECE